DGIRDFHVTGVQTCALPISPWPVPHRIRGHDPAREPRPAPAAEPLFRTLNPTPANRKEGAMRPLEFGWFLPTAGDTTCYGDRGKDRKSVVQGKRADRRRG